MENHMIKVDNNNLFYLQTVNALYVMQVTPNKELFHCYFGPALRDEYIENFSPDMKLDSNFSYQNMQSYAVEVRTFGDIIYQNCDIKLNYKLSNNELIRDCRLKFKDYEIITSEPNNKTYETLIITLEDIEYEFELKLYYQVYPQYDIIEKYCEVINCSNSTEIIFEKLSFSGLNLPNYTDELTSFSGRWGHEFTSERKRLVKGTTLLESHGLITGSDSQSSFLINNFNQCYEECGTCYFGTLAYSGNYEVAIEYNAGGSVHISGAYNPWDFELVLKPKSRHITPKFIIGCSQFGWGGASRNLHQFILNQILPKPKNQNKFRPVLYNGWESCEYNFDLTSQKSLAEKVAKLGVELFCVDDGWYSSRRSDRSGLGDWYSSPEIYPNGISELADHVHSLNMQFGLWIEPEMVNLDSELFRKHPEWILQVPKRESRLARNQYILDFGRTEVTDYIYKTLDKLVFDSKADFLKWDMNRRPSENGSVSNKAIWRKHVEQIYSIIDRLRSKYPYLEIQSCASGGSRIDCGILKRVDQVWTSDNTDGNDRTIIQEGFSMIYPARIMESWVTNEINPQTGRILPLSLRFDVAMRGNLGIGLDINKLSTNELELCQRYIKFYKKIRHVVQAGELYRIKRLEDIGCSIIEYVLNNGEEAVVSIVRHRCRIGEFIAPQKLYKLQPHRKYKIFDFNLHQVDERAGYELMTRGFEVNSFYENRDHTGANFSASYYLEII